MNKQDSLNRFAQGRDVWNEWVREKLNERDRMRRSKQWVEGFDSTEWNQLTRAWHEVAAADFSEHVFEDEIDFRGFIFPSSVIFRGAHFRSRVRFSDAVFSGNVTFFKTKFDNTAFFVETKFENNATFDKSIFGDSAEFNKTIFDNFATFYETEFQDASFIGARFNENTWFNKAIFKESVWFAIAIFQKDVLFTNTDFGNGAKFRQAKFMGLSKFDDALFNGDSDFEAIEGATIFSLANVTFTTLPNFIQSHFTEAPRLDHCRIEPRSLRGPFRERVKQHFKGDEDRSAKWQALKRLAIQGHDHVNELKFFKGEVISRRWVTDRPWHAVFWFGLAYQFLSDFGRSIMRPLALWAVGIVVFAFLYLGYHPAIQARPDSSAVVAAYEAIATEGEGGPACIAAEGNSWLAAFGLSLHKATLFLGAGSSAKLNQIYRCLYGVETFTAGAEDRPLARPLPRIPDGVALFGLAQNLYSAVLIFLLLLAFRNHFRIK